MKNRIVLPPDFHGEKYGLIYRFVDEDDAAFIVKLRTDPIKSRYIGSTDGSVENQKEWIRQYKEREHNGTDYYLIFYYGAKPAGVARIYGIEDNHFIHGSWVFANNVPPFCSLAAAIIAREIAYDTLGLEEEIDTSGIHEDNQGVLQVSKMMGVDFYGERESDNGKFLLGRLPKSVFNENKNNILKLIPKKYL
jgi:hypothetical protein